MRSRSGRGATIGLGPRIRARVRAAAHAAAHAAMAPDRSQISSRRRRPADSQQDHVSSSRAIGTTRSTSNVSKPRERLDGTGAPTLGRRTGRRAAAASRCGPGRPIRRSSRRTSPRVSATSARRRFSIGPVLVEQRSARRRTAQHQRTRSDQHTEMRSGVGRPPESATNCASREAIRPAAASPTSNDHDDQQAAADRLAHRPADEVAGERPLAQRRALPERAVRHPDHWRRHRRSAGWYASHRNVQLHRRYAETADLRRDYAEIAVGPEQRLEVGHQRRQTACTRYPSISRIFVVVRCR